MSGKILLFPRKAPPPPPRLFEVRIATSRCGREPVCLSRAFALDLDAVGELIVAAVRLERAP